MLCVLGPWPWPRAFLSLASRVSVLGKAVLGLGLGFFLCPWPWPRALCPRLHLCVLALLIFMPQFKSINFWYYRPKIKLFLHKNCKISERWGLRPQTLFPPAVGDVASKPPMASCDRDCLYLIDNSFVVIFYCLIVVLSTLALVKCLIV